MFNAHSHLLDKDRRQALLVFFGATAAAAILPFAAWRFLQGQWLAGVLDIAIVVGFSTAIWYAWRHQRIEGVALSIAAVVSCGIVLVSPFIGKLALTWVYPILLANLMLTGRKTGFSINLVLIAGLLLVHQAEITGIEQATFACTGILASVYGYVFARATDTQRDRLETLATYDELTGAGNRRMMDRALEVAVSHARRHKTPSAVAVLDLDHFKSINDTFGHEAGDDVLVSLVRICKQALRGDDEIYRMGGEEFVLLVPRTDEPGLMQALERLQAHLRARLVSPAGPVTVSIGAAMLDQDDKDWSDWLARADQALYEAKESGRDQVKVASGSAPASVSGPPAAPDGKSPMSVDSSPAPRKFAA